MNTTRTGEATEATIALRLIELGHVVSNPMTTARYDLVVDTYDGLKRVQCKTMTHPEENRLKADLRARDHKKDYDDQYDDGEVDVFAFHSPHTDEVYWLPIEEAPTRGFRLTTKTIDEVHPSNRSRVNLASDYRVADKLGVQG